MNNEAVETAVASVAQKASYGGAIFGASSLLFTPEFIFAALGLIVAALGALVSGYLHWNLNKRSKAKIEADELRAREKHEADMERHASLMALNKAKAEFYRCPHKLTPDEERAARALDIDTDYADLSEAG